VAALAPGLNARRVFGESVASGGDLLDPFPRPGLAVFRSLPKPWDWIRKDETMAIGLPAAINDSISLMEFSTSIRN
jgi:hypothetical protein